MRYTEPKPLSAELLRLSLAQMGRHEAAFNPMTFTLWYEHVAGINPKLSHALENLSGEARIDDDTVANLYKEHVLAPDEETVTRIGSAMQQVMSSVAQTASETGMQAGSYGQQLSGLSKSLSTQGLDTLTPQLSQVLASTAEMQATLQALQERVAKGQNEIEQLRDDLVRARSEALVDALTGVLNRKGFDRKLEQLQADAAANRTELCLLMLDIDHFKKVNDTHGHPFGDRVIQAVGEILRASVKDTGYVAARYGGEEFALLLPGLPLDRAATLADDVRMRTKAMKIRDRRTQDVVLTITISGGVAALQNGEEVNTLVQRADAALYLSKKEGRDRITRG